MRPEEGAVEMFELRVMTGLHQGAALPLVGEQWLIGANDGLDLALHDPGVEQRHCRLQREGEHWTLSAEDGTVTDNEGHAHTLTTLEPNSPFILGSVWLALCAADEPWPTLPVLSPGPAAHGNPEPVESVARRSPVKSRVSLFNRMTLVILGALVGVVGSAWSLSYHASPSESLMSSLKTGEKASTGAQHPLLSAEQAKLKLKSMLSERLLNEVTVEQTPQGLILRGNLQNEARLVFKRMLQRFDDSYKSAVTVVDEVSTGGSSLPFAIVQIMSGPQAHLVTADGKRMYIGDVLNGLRLTRIDDGRVEFEGDRHYEVSW
jgi:type III secretion protein D